MSPVSLDKSGKMRMETNEDGRELLPARITARLESPVYAAPAMYRAMRPQLEHRRVTCERGGGGTSRGSRSIRPAQVGQLSGSPFRSLEMSCSACAGL